MSVHYKFKSALEYDTVTFDGLHISVHDLKKSILHQKRIGKNTDFDLQITNAQTKEVYVDDGALIPKNTSLIVARVPLTAQQKKAWDRAESNQQLIGLSNVAEGPFDGQDPGVQKLATAVDLSSLDASEEDKIQAMMTQSTQDYNPSNYRKIKYANQMGEVPPTYRCFKCHQQGHWIKDCPLATVSEPIEIKKSTGIPRSFMVPVEGPSVPGAMMTPNGQFAVPAIDHLAYKEGKKEKPPFQHEPEPVVQKPEIPEDLQCSVCKDLLADAVMIPCCGNSFCDECIRTVLLESEDHECPDCKEKDVSPETLIPNRFLRTSVNNFKKGTGYNKLSSNRRSVLQHRPNLQAVKPAPMVCVESMGQAVPVIGRSSPAKIQTQSTVDYSDILSESSRDGTVPQVITSSPLIQVQTCETTNTIPVLGAPKPVTSVISTSLEARLPSLRETVIHIETAAPKMRPEVSVHRSAMSEARHRQTQQVPTTQIIHCDIQHSNNAGGANGVVSMMSIQSTSVPSLSIRQCSAATLQAVEHAPGIIQAGATFAAGHRRSVEERPGTPTIDEHNLDNPVTHPPPTLPDTSVPPPNFPAGEDQGSQAHQIQSLGTRSHGIPPMFRSEAPYPSQHRLGGLLPEHTQPLPLPTSEYIRSLNSRQVHNTQQPAARGYSVRGQVYETGHFHQETGSRGSHYSEGDGHHIGRGSYRYNRGRGRMIHGYRGNHLHNQPPPPGLGRNAQNDPATGAIEDPLEAFERMLREKDDRDRKLRRNRRPTTRSRSRSYTPHSRSTSTRSYTRSRTRSRSRTPRSRTPRSRTPRSRTPRKRSRTRTRSRSRSRSFTISRSRSRTFSRSPTPRQQSRDREYSPRRRAASRYRTPNRSPPRFQRPFKEVRSDFDSATPYFEPEYQYANSGNRGRGGRFGQRKDFNKDYYEQNYSRYGNESRFHEAVVSREVHRVDATPRYGPQQSHRRYDHYSDVAPPGTEAELLPLSQQRYDRAYEHQGGGYDSRQQQAPTPEDFLSPPGVDYRRAEPLAFTAAAATVRDRDRDAAVSSGGGRERGVGGGRDRDRDRGDPRDRDAAAWDGGRGGREAAETNDRGRDKDRDFGGRERDRDRERERERERDYYNDNGDHHRNYDKAYNYNSPDVKKRRGGSASPSRQGRGRDGYSGAADRHHRHGGGTGGLGDRRRNTQRDGGGGGGKENRVSSREQPEPVKAIDVTHDRKGRDPDLQTRDRERVPVLVEVRKEPSVEKDRSKKDDKAKKDDDKEKDKKVKDKKKKKRERDGENDKGKKKKRKEKGKKDPQDLAKEQEKSKISSSSSSTVRKEKVAAKMRAEEEAHQLQASEASHTPEKPCPNLVVPAVTVEEKPKVAPISTVITEKSKGSGARNFEPPQKDPLGDLYGDMEDARIDNSVIANYGKVDQKGKTGSGVRSHAKESDQHAAQETQAEGHGEAAKEGGVVKTESELEDAKADVSLEAEQSEATKANVMLAPLPEPSKWELDEELPGQLYDDKSGDERLGAAADKSGKMVTSEVLKRAENAIFQKAINAIRPIEPTKKVSAERKVYASGGGGGEKEKSAADPVDDRRKVVEKDTREARKTANSIQITIPIAGHAERSIELSPAQNASSAAKVKSKLDRSKFGGAWGGDGGDTASPQRVPAKERLGARVDAPSSAKDSYQPRGDRRTKRRSNSRDRDRSSKHTARKGLKSAVERKKSPSKSRSRSPHYKATPKDAPRFADNSSRYADAVADLHERKHAEAAAEVARRSRRDDRDSRDVRYGDADRERGGVRYGDKRNPSPEKRRDQRSLSREKKADRLKHKEDSDEKSRNRHKAKRKTKSRRSGSESRSHKKSASDKESRHGKKRDKKHKKEKIKKHKQKGDKDDKKEGENGSEKEVGNEAEPVETKDGNVTPVEVKKAAPAPSSGNAVEAKSEMQSDQAKEKPRKGFRRNPRLASDRKKSTLDEASFEPDYDASSSLDSDADDVAAPDADRKQPSAVVHESPKKRDRSASAEDAGNPEKKRVKAEKEAAEEGKKTAKAAKASKKRVRSASSSKEDDSSEEESSDDSSSSASSSSSDDSSEDSSVRRHRRKKSHRRRHKRTKKSSRHADTSSDSDSDSDSDDASSSDSDGRATRKAQARAKKKHHRVKAKASKKKKKSKHR